MGTRSPHPGPQVQLQAGTFNAVSGYRGSSARPLRTGFAQQETRWSWGFGCLWTRHHPGWAGFPVQATDVQHREPRCWAGGSPLPRAPELPLWFSRPRLTHPSHWDSTVTFVFNIPNFLPSVDVCTGSLFSRRKERRSQVMIQQINVNTTPPAHKGLLLAVWKAPCSLTSLRFKLASH